MGKVEERGNECRRVSLSVGSKNYSPLKCWQILLPFFQIAFFLIINEMENLFACRLAVLVLILHLSFHIFFSLGFS